MIRRAFTIASGLSLVLFAATLVLWVRSYRQKDSLTFQRDNGLWEVASYDGRLWLDNEPQRELEEAPLKRLQRRVEDAGPAEELDRRLAKALEDGSTTEERQLLQARMKISAAQLAYLQLREQFHLKPVTRSMERSLHWGVTLAATAALPVIWLMCATLSWRRRVVCRTRNLCPRCGYDLRASAERCPECGMPVPGPVRA